MNNKHYDIVIIGSGAGGGTVAATLAPLVKQGLRIAVLEAGPKFRENEYTGRELEMAQKLYAKGGGMMTADGSMSLAMGCGYGGSTIVYTGTSILIEEQTVNAWGIKGLDWKDLTDRSRKYMVQNNVHLLDESLLNDNNKLFYQGCKTLGYHVAQFPLNVKGCKGSSLCNFGCPNGAKQGTLRVQLPAAESAGVEVVTNCEVRCIDGKTLQASVITREVGETSAWEAGDYIIHADRIVLSAGAIQSPALLLRSGLEAALPSLGRYFTCHPALILVGEHRRPIKNFYGHPKSFYSEEFIRTEKFLLETCMYFPFVTAKSLAGFGAGHQHLMENMDHLQMILVLALDEAQQDNRIALDRNGQPRVHYRFSEQVLDAFVASQRASAKIFFAAGARRVHAPSAKNFFIEAQQANEIDTLIHRRYQKLGRIAPAAAHLMGGCRMGNDDNTSVTDAWGRVHGHDHLYVADASLFPGSAEINPYLTIMGLADRVAEGICKELAATP